MKPTHILAAALITALIFAGLTAPAAALEGSGTQADPYLISSFEDLNAIVNTGTYTYYLQTQDIVITSWSPTSGPIGICNLYGSYDGAGYSIDCSGFPTSSNYNLWIFLVYSNSHVQNIKFENINGYFRNGALIGTNDGTNTASVSNIVISGDITGQVGVGTLYVRDINNVIIVDSTMEATVGYSNDGAYRRYSPFFTASSDSSNTYSVQNSVVLSTNIVYKTASSKYTGYRIGYGTVSNCYAASTTINGVVPTSNIGANAYNGATITATQYNSESWWKTTMSMWDWENVWQWNDETNLPELRNANNQAVPPTISAITATPATGGQLTGYTLSVIATTEAAGRIASYQWSYSTDSGTTWQPITGATAATYVWTPGTSISGTVLLKCYITGADGGTVDSYEAGYTNIQITVYPPPDISTISVSRPLQKVNTPTALTATLTESEPSTYQWYYSTNGGTTWQPISGATALTAEYTPTTTGTHSVKIVVTNTYGESNELTTNFNVLPTYTPTQISNTSVDINIPGTAKYQGQTQFTLSDELKALEYFDTDRAHLAHDNALYYLDSAERQIIPLAGTTGNTISSCYIGQYTGVITDISGNTAFYNYQTNTWQYIEQLSADILASTTTYAATISGTTLNLYNLNGNKVDDIETTLTNLAGNDAANTFAGYSGKTLTYYWLSGNQLSSGSQTLAHTITDVHQVPGTENYVISTTANTYIVSISNTGAYSQVMETETADPLLHTQATTINVLIGVSDPNEIYVVGSDGETDGTYVSGSTLTDASIAKSTGLYAIAGGADRQAYILGKSESSTWQLTQVISFGESVDYSQISTTGTYAAVATGLKLYLLEAVDISTGTYMLQGVIIGSSGNPYAGKLISINGDQIRTDTSGRFLYPVTPNTLYTIVADTTTTEYTATSAALQQIAIRLKPNPFAQSVSYSATYNEDTGNFEMLYEDSRDLTQQVTWTIRETGDNTIVHQVTVQPGQTATWPVPFDKVFTGYQISMDAERGSINVENVWMITPAGSQPINIPGLDDTGKNIIFGCVLMVIAGLFGVMFSTKGAIFVVLAAGVMTFLGLLTIPWEIIIVAGLLAFLAALAKGGGGQ